MNYCTLGLEVTLGLLAIGVTVDAAGVGEDAEGDAGGVTEAGASGAFSGCNNIQFPVCKSHANYLSYIGQAKTSAEHTSSTLFMVPLRGGKQTRTSNWMDLVKTRTNLLLPYT